MHTLNYSRLSLLLSLSFLRVPIFTYESHDLYLCERNPESLYGILVPTVIYHRKGPVNETELKELWENSNQIDKRYLATVTSVSLPSPPTCTHTYEPSRHRYFGARNLQKRGG